MGYWRQRFLLPVDMMDWLPGDDVVHLIVDAVGLMDLSTFEASCRTGGAGQAPFSSRMLLTLLIYADSHGIRSMPSRSTDLAAAPTASRMPKPIFLSQQAIQPTIHSDCCKRSTNASLHSDRLMVVQSPCVSFNLHSFW